MPIGLLIGWLIGQSIAAFIIHRSMKLGNIAATQNDTRRFTIGWCMLSLILLWTGLLGLIGTLIELWIVHG